MFISKMNRMFHKYGKIAFLILTLAIIVPMVLYFSAAPSELLDMFDFRAKDSDVQMNGKTISDEILQNSVTNTLLTMAISGRNVDFQSMRDQKEVVQEAAKRILLLKAADERGLKVDDLSVADFIKQIPMFQVKGNFNVNMYKMFVTYYLGRYRITEEQFENAIRENLVINMLQNQTTASVIASLEEVHQYYNDLNKEFQIQVARFNSKDFTDKVNVKNDALKAYFEKNRSKYLIPAKYKFHAVRFNFISFKSEAEKAVTEKMIEDTYNTEKDSKYKGKKEDDAKVEIKKDLIDTHCEKLAKNEAQKFAVAAYKQIENAGSDNKNVKAYQIFDKIADAGKYTTHSVNDWVTTETKVIPRMGKVPEITSILGKLYIDQPISNAVKGSNAFFVVCLSDKVDPRQAKFDEVKDKVLEEYKAHDAGKLAQKAAEDTYKKIATAEKNNKDISSLGVKFENVPEFSQKNYMPLLKVQDGVQIYQAVTKTAKGKVSEPLDLDDGAVLVYVKGVTLPSEKEFKKQQEAVTKEYIQFKKWLLWYNYSDNLVAKANIVIADKKN